MKRIALPLDRIRRLYERGWTIKRLAAKYFVSYWAMYCRLNEMGIIRRKTRKELSPKEMEFQVKEAGLTRKEIADINGVSSRTVIRKMKNSQIKDFKHYGKINRAVIIGVHYMRFDKKMKLQAIADSFGLSRRTICTVVKMDITPHENAIRIKGEEVTWNR